MARRTPPPQLIGSGLIPGIFEEQYRGAEDAYQSALADLGRSERSLFADYGFTGGVNEGGTVNFQVDPNAQFGMYQGLLRNIGSQLGAAKQEVRGRGIGRAGLAKARENLIRFMMSGEKANLLTNFNRSASDLFGKRGQALTARNRAFSDIEGGALDWWNQYGPEDPDGSIPEPQAQAVVAPDSWENAGGYTGAIPPNQLAGAMFDVGQEYAPAIAPSDPMFNVNQGMTFDPALSAYGAPRRRRSGSGGFAAEVM